MLVILRWNLTQNPEHRQAGHPGHEIHPLFLQSLLLTLARLPADGSLSVQKRPENRPSTAGTRKTSICIPTNPVSRGNSSKRATRRSWSANGTCPLSTNTTPSTNSDSTSIKPGGSSTTQGRKTTRFWTPYLIRNGTVIADQIKERYGPDVDFEFHLDFIKSNAQKQQPFLAYYATCLPHFPWEPTPDSEDKSYRQPVSGHKGDPKYFPDMVAYLDKHVGLIMRTLEDLGIADNTIVIFLCRQRHGPGSHQHLGRRKENPRRQGHHDRPRHPRSAHRALARPHQGRIHVR